MIEINLRLTFNERKLLLDLLYDESQLNNHGGSYLARKIHEKIEVASK